MTTCPTCGSPNFSYETRFWTAWCVNGHRFDVHELRPAIWDWLRRQRRWERSVAAIIRSKSVAIVFGVDAATLLERLEAATPPIASGR